MIKQPKSLKKLSKVINEHYVEEIMSKHGDIMNAYPDQKTVTIKGKRYYTNQKKPMLKGSLINK